jgi:hypothetical protein
MVVDKEISISVKSPVIIQKLKSIGIEAKFQDVVIIPIERLWIGSNFLVNVICDICGFEKEIRYCLYQKNIKNHNIYCCSNKCSSIKNKKTCLEKYGFENYTNIEKAKSTNLDRYGFENYMLTEEFKIKSRKSKFEKYGHEYYNNIEKVKHTNMEKYGVTNTFQADEFKEKIRATNIEKYGCEDSRSSVHTKEKRINTTRERYGVDFYTKTKEYLEKVKNTSMERYGFTSPNMSNLVKKNKVKSMIEKYGFISNSMTEESKKKLRDTNLQKYGVEYPMQFLEFSENQQKSAKRISYYNDILYYQGSYERHFLDYMSEKKLIGIIQRGFPISYSFEGVDRMHYPDFYIDDYNLIVEIKSDYYYNKYLNKNISRMNKCVEMGYNYIFVINKNYIPLNTILGIG